MTFVVQALIMAGTAAALITNDAFRSGFFILAAVPPAVAVIPFTLFVKGDSAFSGGTIGAYLGALVMSPRNDGPSPGFRLHRSLKANGHLPGTDPWGPSFLPEFWPAPASPPSWSHITSPSPIGAFSSSYTPWSRYQQGCVCRQPPLNPAGLSVVALFTTFLMGWVIEVVAGMLRCLPRCVPGVPLGTFKNYGLAGGIVLVFSPPKPWVLPRLFCGGHILHRLAGVKGPEKTP